MTAATRLKAALKGLDLHAIAALAERAGVSVLAARRARKARTVTVDEYLKLCAAIGIGPVTGDPLPPCRLGDFHPNSFGVAAHMVRIQRDEKQREFARAAGLSASTVCRIERAEEVMIESVLKMCALLGRHPHDFVSQAVPRETQNTERRSAA